MGHPEFVPSVTSASLDDKPFRKQTAKKYERSGEPMNEVFITGRAWYLHLDIAFPWVGVAEQLVS